LDIGKRQTEKERENRRKERRKKKSVHLGRSNYKQTTKEMKRI
jgi:hypothetical protein